MEPSEHPSVVVIGAGIVGSAIAMHLAERGLRPLLVDADQDPAGDGTSARSFASLSAFGADPVGYYELACAALATWPRWAERLGEVGLRHGGQLRWEADPTEARRLTKRVEQARSRGYPVMPVGETELRRTAAEPGAVTAACHAPRDGQVEPHLVVAACRAATQAAGGRVLLGEPAALAVPAAERPPRRRRLRPPASPALPSCPGTRPARHPPPKGHRHGHRHGHRRHLPLPYGRRTRGRRLPPRDPSLTGPLSQRAGTTRPTRPQRAPPGWSWNRNGATRRDRWSR
jgi:hypothetical protein